MPLFAIEGKQLNPINQLQVSSGVTFREHIERNFSILFNCYKLNSNMLLGSGQVSKLDILGISEDANPVIVSLADRDAATLINQGIYHLQWLKEHKADYEEWVAKELGGELTVDWSFARIICLAADFKMPDILAAKMLGAPIELWKYRYYGNDSLLIEELPMNDMGLTVDRLAYHKSGVPDVTQSDGKDIDSCFDQHLEGKSVKIKQLANALREFILSLASSIQEVPKRRYVAYKTSQNIVSMDVRRNKITVRLKLSPEDIVNPPINYRDISRNRYISSGDSEFLIQSQEDVEVTKFFIQMAYQKIGV